MSAITHAERKPIDDAANLAPNRAWFVRQRLGSLLAIAPLGVWSMLHLYNNLAAFQGGPAWQIAVTEYGSPVAQIGTYVIVFVPLLWHTLWGTGRIVSSRPNYPRYGYLANLRYLLQRLSALGLALFLGAHLWLALLHPRLVEGHAEPFEDIAHEMRFHGPTLVVYLLGTLALAYHLANGFSAAAWGTWGILASRRAVRRWDSVAWFFFLLFLAMGWGGVYALWRAGSMS
jgi:succinate dehydrogenase / fumarate reductase cytochrome b subunit